MVDDAVAKCRAGVTSAAEVLRVTTIAVTPMPNFRYRALTANGELVSGSISAATAAEVARRIERARPVLVDNVRRGGAARVRASVARRSSTARRPRT